MKDIFYGKQALDKKDVKAVIKTLKSDFLTGNLLQKKKRSLFKRFKLF